MKKPRRWTLWMAAIALIAGGILLVGLPLGGSFLITHASFSFPEGGLLHPSEAGLEVADIVLEAADGLRIEAWWQPGDPSLPAIVFVHGLNRTRLEMVERAIEAAERGYGALLIELRNHGASDPASMTLGVHESRDVCAGARYIRDAYPDRAVAVWGVSLGAATSVLAAARCPDAIAAAIADSSYLSVGDTVSHHFRMMTRLPAFPIADLIVAFTGFRMGFAPEEGDVERVIRERPDLPVLIIAGGADVRMPPEVARRLRDASANGATELFEVDGASHGRAFEYAREDYLARAFAFLERAFPEITR